MKPNVIYERRERVENLRLHIECSDRVVKGTVVAMNDDLRGNGVLVRNEDNQEIKYIMSDAFPELRSDRLFVRGNATEDDDTEFERVYPNSVMAAQAALDILDLMAKLNSQ